MAMNMNDLVEKYIKLRNKKKDIMQAAKDEAAKIDAVLDKVEALLLQSFSAQGIDNISTKAGTAYKTTRSSARVADWGQILKFITANNEWDFLEKRVSKDAVKAYREEHNMLPPGVDWSEEIVLNVRK